ncbi:hypothetical protein [Ancylobacter vacuolatus]|uniref:Oxidoreductase n=1 Tax=Ancylobacter vacuolatus TaxID=223389 RepID=A0ABU0DPB9_9HYPH|nr:hypothetical protein [Ancylobacter vacuolatus]MDQ0350128.1 hypothetical protein [Ancylobacter vacuolatus]
MAVTPADVAEAMLRATTAPRHRLRYPVGKVAEQVGLLSRIMPARLFDKALRQQFGPPS